LINWGANTIVVFGFPLLDNAIGAYTFFIFGGLLLFFTLFTVFFVPETKGRSTDEISQMFSNRLIFLDSN
jgi:hypothetical protein